MRKVSATVLIFIVAASQLSWAWGPEGHQIIALVAEDHLDQTTKVMIRSLLGNNRLYSVAEWADDILRSRPETKTWHYANIPLGDSYLVGRDCAAPRSCIVEKISEYVAVLRNKKATRQQRTEALKFIVNLVGDVHQPMHAVKEAAGAKEIRVRFSMTMQPCPGISCQQRVETTLHGLWDMFPLVEMGLPQHATNVEKLEYAKYLERVIKAKSLGTRSGGTPEQWANESVGLAKAAWVEYGAELDARYYDKEIGVVNSQMSLAGLRLAKLLNDSLGKMTPSDFQ